MATELQIRTAARGFLAEASWHHKVIPFALAYKVVARFIELLGTRFDEEMKRPGMNEARFGHSCFSVLN